VSINIDFRRLKMTCPECQKETVSVKIRKFSDFEDNTKDKVYKCSNCGYSIVWNEKYNDINFKELSGGE
jgi:Ogr/Delta-like zinc finger.